MNKIFSIMSLALAILAVSCTKQETPGEGSGTSAVITVKESDLKIPAKGGTARIVFETNVPFEVTVDKDWCDKSVSGNTVTFTADMGSTGIKSPVSDMDTDSGDRIYNLNGICVGNGTEKLPKGVYVRNGRKFVVQ